MQKLQFGSSGVKVAVVGQGTWYQSRKERDLAVDGLRAGIEAGMTHLDTAEMYLDGEAEEWLAAAMAGSRNQIYLVSKVLPENASLRGTVAACERSLARLRTDRLDCYLLHWRGRHPLEDTVAAFEQLRQSGKILAWGVSNFDVEDLEELHTKTGRLPVCNQVLYHLRERAIEHAVLPWCQTHGVAMVGYSPFGHDSFPAPTSAGGKVLQEIADRHQATPRQAALGFLLRLDGCFTIPKASQATHARENAAAGQLQLTPEELRQIDIAFPLRPRPRSLPML